MDVNYETSTDTEDFECTRQEGDSSGNETSDKEYELLTDFSGSEDLYQSDEDESDVRCCRPIRKRRWLLTAASTLDLKRLPGHSSDGEGENVQLQGQANQSPTEEELERWPGHSLNVIPNSRILLQAGQSPSAQPTLLPGRSIEMEGGFTQVKEEAAQSLPEQISPLQSIRLPGHFLDVGSGNTQNPRQAGQPPPIQPTQLLDHSLNLEGGNVHLKGQTNQSPTEDEIEPRPGHSLRVVWGNTQLKSQAVQFSPSQPTLLPGRSLEMEGGYTQLKEEAAQSPPEKTSPLQPIRLPGNFLDVGGGNTQNPRQAAQPPPIQPTQLLDHSLDLEGGNVHLKGQTSQSPTEEEIERRPGHSLSVVGGNAHLKSQAVQSSPSQPTLLPGHNLDMESGNTQLKEEPAQVLPEQTSSVQPIQLLGHSLIVKGGNFQLQEQQFASFPLLLHTVDKRKIKHKQYKSHSQSAKYIDLPPGHSLQSLPKGNKRYCTICRCFSRKWCPGCGIGIHVKCFPLLLHYFRKAIRGRRVDAKATLTVS